MATQKDGAFALDFPQNLAHKLDEATRSDLAPLLAECEAVFGAGKIVDAAYAPGCRNLLIRLHDEVDLENLPLDPNRLGAAHDNQLRKTGLNGIIATVKGSPKKNQENYGQEVDFVSRYFGPWIGIPEDHVCGSAHTSLAPYWTGVLGKNVGQGMSSRLKVVAEIRVSWGETWDSPIISNF